MKERYLSSDKVGTLLGLSKRTVNRRIQKGIYSTISVQGKGGRDGKKTLIDIYSLPQEVQNKCYEINDNNDTDSGALQDSKVIMPDHVKNKSRDKTNSEHVATPLDCADNQENKHNSGENAPTRSCQKKPLSCQNIESVDSVANNKENGHNLGDSVPTRSCQIIMSKSSEQNQGKNKEENVKYTWLTTTEACKLLKIKRSALIYRLKNSEYVYKKGTKNKNNPTLIALESLPFEAQQKYKRIDNEIDNVIEKQAINAMKMRYLAQEDGLDIEKNVSLVELDRAWQKYLLIQDLIKTKRGGIIRKVEEISAFSGKSRATIFRYYAEYCDGGVMGLLRKKRQDTGDKRATLPLLVEKWILSMAKKNQNISDLKNQAQKRFKVYIPRRRVRELVEEMHLIFTAKTSAANLENMYEPYIRRTAEGHTPNECWFGDTHPVDALVIYKGKEIRPYLTAWLDAVTRAFVGYILSPTPINQDNIRLSLSNAIDEQDDHFAFGLPETVYIDNGKDFIARAILSGIHDLASLRGIEKSVIKAKPYNAKAKVIEPIFKQIESIIIKNFPGYVGNNPQNRPVAQKGKAVKAVWTYDRFCKEFQQGLEMYHNRKNKSIGASPLQKWREFEVEGWAPTQIDPQQLAVAFARREWRAVRRGFVQVNNTPYYSDELVGFSRTQQVEVRFHDRFKGVVWIFDQHQKYVCTAIADRAVDMFNADESEMEEIHRRKKVLKTKIRKLDKSVDDLDVWEEKKKSLVDSFEDSKPVSSKSRVSLIEAYKASIDSKRILDKRDKEREDEKEYVHSISHQIATTKAEKEYLEQLKKLKDEENHQAGGDNND